MEDKTEKKQKPQLWSKGQSGNPSGRPKGTRNFNTLFKEAITKLALAEGKTLEELEDELLQVGFQKAKKGDFKFYQDFIDRLHGKPVNRNENVNANVDMNNLLTEEEREKIKQLLNANPKS